ncbi:hypothetical protein [Symbiobacterium thermophilum]|uniref:hypothetical protein n=1 Tax=Symbiobacterium thermophilum TaxID=2734 RepID=UPI0023532EEE|nr:hypothetical protein [Symbiobacterium thermophilum]
MQPSHRRQPGKVRGAVVTPAPVSQVGRRAIRAGSFGSTSPPVLTATLDTLNALDPHPGLQ